MEELEQSKEALASAKEADGVKQRLVDETKRALARTQRQLDAQQQRSPAADAAQVPSCKLVDARLPRPFFRQDSSAPQVWKLQEAHDKVADFRDLLQAEEERSSQVPFASVGSRGNPCISSNLLKHRKQRAKVWE